jgi:DNA-directed RNA polymerase subunit RPC12/RpoP
MVENKAENRIQIDNCTRCGRPFKDFRIYITLSTRVERITELSTWEEIQNLSNDVSEVLCSECFDQFAEIQNQMNIPHNPDNNVPPINTKESLEEEKSRKFAGNVEIDYDVIYTDEGK